jgi:glucosamine--fructose-6-phosphate aminotransferase (isomerizing)
MGEKTRRGIAVQPDWLRALRVEQRVAGRAAFTGCGTSWHAAQAAQALVAIEALEAALAPPEADVLVVVSHEGGTFQSLQAAKAFGGPVWLVTAKPDSPLGELAEEVVVCSPEPDPSYCHTAAYTCGVAAVRALLGEDTAALADAVAERLDGPRFPLSAHERFVVTGAGRDWTTAQEAVLKLREGVHVAAEAHRTEELLHGHLAAIDSSVRAFVLEGEGPAAERSAEAVRALELVGCDVTLVPTSHPVVDIVPFQLLTVDLADDRGLDPDFIRWDEEPWNEARKSYR